MSFGRNVAVLEDVTFRAHVPDWNRVSGFFLTSDEDPVAGWHDGLDVTAAQVAQLNGLGEHEVVGSLGGRNLTLKGVCVATSEGELLAYRDQFTRLVKRSYERITVDSLGEQRWARCRRNGTPTFRPRRGGKPGRVVADFLLQLRCSDPRQYGETTPWTPFGASATLENRGNENAWPRLRVRATSAATGGYTLYDGLGHQFQVVAPLSAGRVHTVDLRTAQVRTDLGNLVSRARGAGNVWPVPDNGSVFATVFAPAGVVQLSGQLEPTWV